MKTKRIAMMLALTVAGAILNGCGGSAALNAENLMAGIRAEGVEAKTPDDTFISAQYDFALGLLRGEVARAPESNIVIAPYSLSQTLAMAANGANGVTRTELEVVLGGSAETMNGCFSGLRLPTVNSAGGRLLSANSIWLRNDPSLTVSQDFLQTNADCYGADVYKTAFDDVTRDDMNNWIADKTDGKLADTLKSFDGDTELALLNVLTFESQWAEKYTEKQISEREFRSETRGKQTAEFMHSQEDVFLWSKDAIGFTKPYKELGGRNYEFLAVKPMNGTLAEYLAGVTAETFPQPDEKACSYAGLPKFGFTSESLLNDTLKEMGVQAAFSGETADFKSMATTDSGNIYLGSVTQKVRIDVDDEGTKAEAVTIQFHAVSSADPVPEGQQQVILDRPFLFMIRDADTQVPLFAGVIQNVE